MNYSLKNLKINRTLSQGPGIKHYIQTKWPDAEIINERFAA